MAIAIQHILWKGLWGDIRFWERDKWSRNSANPAVGQILEDYCQPQLLLWLTEVIAGSPRCYLSWIEMRRAESIVPDLQYPGEAKGDNRVTKRTDIFPDQKSVMLWVFDSQWRHCASSANQLWGSIYCGDGHNSIICCRNSLFSHKVLPKQSMVWRSKCLNISLRRMLGIPIRFSHSIFWRSKNKQLQPPSRWVL